MKGDGDDEVGLFENIGQLPDGNDLGPRNMTPYPSLTRANIKRPSPTKTKRQMQKRFIARVRLSSLGGINEVIYRRLTFNLSLIHI